MCLHFFDLFLLISDEYDAYIVVSFVNATLVLSIGETVEEITDSGFLGTTPTLTCSLLGDDALLQVRCCALTNTLQMLTHSNMKLKGATFVIFIKREGES